ncbi:MAG: hypothetical protein U0744_14850 [Gemmataceae bacterium]
MRWSANAVASIATTIYKSWPRGIPKTAAISEDSVQLLPMAEKAGFTAAFVFPRLRRQMEHLDCIIEETARKPASGIPDNQQYREPFLADTMATMSNGKVLQRDDDLGPRNDGPYLYLYNPDPHPSARGKTARQIGEYFLARGWQGLTVPEYLILQRYLCERHKDHRFHDQGEVPERHWMWLIDSMTETECAIAMADVRGINIQAAPAVNRDSKRTVIAGLVVPIRKIAEKA